MKGNRDINSEGINSLVPSLFLYSFQAKITVIIFSEI